MTKTEKILENLIEKSNVTFGKTFKTLNESNIFTYLFNVKEKSDLDKISENKNRIKNVTMMNIGNINKAIKNTALDISIKGIDTSEFPSQQFLQQNNENSVSNTITVVNKTFLEADKKTNGKINYSKEKTSDYIEYATGIILKTFAIAGSASSVYMGSKYISKYGKFGKPFTSTASKVFIFSIVPVMACVLVLVALFQSVKNYKELSSKNDIDVKSNLKRICSEFLTSFMKYKKSDITWAIVGSIVASFTYFIISNNWAIIKLSNGVEYILKKLQTSLKSNKIIDGINKAGKDLSDKSLFLGDTITWAKNKIVNGISGFSKSDVSNIANSEFSNPNSKRAKVSSSIKFILLTFIAMTVIYVIVEMIDSYNRKKLIDEVKKEDDK